MATPIAGHLTPSPSYSPPLANKKPPYTKRQPMGCAAGRFRLCTAFAFFPLGSRRQAGLRVAGVGLSAARRAGGQ